MGPWDLDHCSLEHEACMTHVEKPPNQTTTPREREHSRTREPDQELTLAHAPQLLFFLPSRTVHRTKQAIISHPHRDMVTY